MDVALFAGLFVANTALSWIMFRWMFTSRRINYWIRYGRKRK